MTQRSSPRVTVVMPSYNQVRFLESAICSVLSQGDALAELIILDGGSTDGSREVIQRYAKHLTYWRSAPDRGQAAAISEGFDRATGEILAWLNSDDLLLPGALSRVVRQFEAESQVEIVSGYLYYIDEVGHVVKCPQVLTGNHFLASLGVVNVNQQATFFKQSLYKEVGGVDVTLHCAMDMDLWSRFHLHRSRWCQIPTYLAAFRKHANAKGGQGDWWVRYQQEKAKVRSRYPELFGPMPKQRLGLALYRMLQLVSGRQLSSALVTRRLSGTAVPEGAE